MSLFHLFSKPKVERARGYGDRGSATPNTAPAKGGVSSRHEALPTLHAPSDSSSVKSSNLWSFRQRNQSIPSKVQPPEFKPPPRDRKPIPFTPPPLFQAFPQSVKDGHLMVASSTDWLPVRTKGRTPSATNIGASDTLPSEADEEKSSAETSHFQTVLSKDGSIKHSAHLTKKIFVLVTSGYLLQYSETGDSDRLPEKMLPLGRESAAFASDLIAGRPYALQVAGAIDQRGLAVPAQSNLLSRLVRGANARRMASNYVLAMKDADEMETWMTAIRRQIEMAGGRKMSADTSTRPATAAGEAAASELHKTPSHRYLVKRDPSKISNVSSPASTPASEMPSFIPPVPPNEEGKAEPSRPQSSLSDAATIDDIEAEASRLAEDKDESTTVPAGPSEPETASRSATSSVNENSRPSSKLRLTTSMTSSFSPKTEPLGANAVTSPLSTRSFLESPNSDTDSNYGTEPARSGSIQALSPTSPVDSDPASLAGFDAWTPPKITHDAVAESPVVGRNPVLPLTTPPTNATFPTRVDSHLQPLETLNSWKDKRDSKIPPSSTLTSDLNRPESILADLPPPSTWTSSKPPTVNRRFSGAPVPLSTSPPTHSTSFKSPRSSDQMPAGILKQSSPSSRSSPAELTRANSRRLSSFSIPLKVNPSTSWNQNEPSLNNRRASRLSDPDPSNGEPGQVVTLTAKLEPQTVKRFSLSPTPTASPISEKPPPIPNRAPSSARLSIFPHQIVPSNTSATTSPVDTNSKGSPSPPPTISTAQALPLRRPTSLQVRADRAPFLSNVRNSTIGPPPPLIRRPSNPSRGPYRGGLRTSRSASNMPSLTEPSSFSHQIASPPSAFQGLDFGTACSPEPVAEGEDEFSFPAASVEAQTTDAVDDISPETETPVFFASTTSSHSAQPSMSNAWSNAASGSQRSSRRGSSIPSLKAPHDLILSAGAGSRLSVRPRTSISDINTNGLGFGPPAPPPSAPLPPPPAPPPSAPLPPPPAGAPAMARVVSQHGRVSSRGLGFSVPVSASSLPSSAASADTRPPGLGGLGIQVS